ncbi:MAG: hypothetical protein EOO36_18715 [Cytophagaceae bacterium]|nr:MAG: hypothetical protein EOO36_18715 [Cytophagaceae bacterium]
MKLQLSPQSLRLRLEEADIHAFDQAGELSNTLPLGGGPGFTYTLRQLPPAAPEGLAARYEAGAIVVEVPAAQARQLIDGAVVSLKSESRGTDGQLIRILVEKDLGPSH